MSDHDSNDLRVPESVSARRSVLRSIAAGAGLAAFGSTMLTACGGGADDPMASASAVEGSKQAQGTKTKIDTPIISCVATGRQSSITVQVCAPSGAGATGLPAGFSIQWMTQADFVANGGVWYASDDPRLCKASFSGNAFASRYNLLPGECTTVTIGDTLLDNGASTNCPDALPCGTNLVIHAFGHATSKLLRSNWTTDIVCSSAPCTGGSGCTYTQGWWKTHGAAGPASDKVIDPVTGAISYVSVWPVASLTLGTVTYDAAQLQSIFDTAVAGNGLLALAHQLIAAKLNIANGSDPTAIAATIAAADAMIGALVIPPVGADALSPGVTSALVSALTDYNEGATGPGHCP